MLSVAVIISLVVIGCAPKAALLEEEVAPQEGEQIVWHLNTSFGSGGIFARSYRYFAECLKERSEGRLILERYYDASLGFTSTESLIEIYYVLFQGIEDAAKSFACANWFSSTEHFSNLQAGIL